MRKQVTYTFMSEADKELILKTYDGTSTTTDKLEKELKIPRKRIQNFAYRNKRTKYRFRQDQVYENSTLTEKQQEVYKQLLSSKELHEIAENLCNSLQTIKQHTSVIYTKLNVKNRIELQAKRIKELEEELKKCQKKPC